MVVARLIVGNADGYARPTKLLEVDDTQAILETRDTRAELRNLRIRTASAPWRAISACYEYEDDWRLTSVGASVGCPH